MSDDQIHLRDVREHYAPLAKVYHEQYDPALLHGNKEYPANYFRLRILIDRLKALGVRRVLDVGIGEGTPAVAFAELGADVRGFDFTPEMVTLARASFERNGLDRNRVIEADIRQPATYAALLDDGPYDALVCAGVMPHVEDDDLALRNMRNCLRPGGHAFVEFRNVLFSLFTMNRYTHAFILDELLPDVPDDVRAGISRDLESRLRMNLPPKRTTTDAGGAGYDAVLSRFHNPFEMAALFAANGFADTRLHWYHYHPAQPYLEGNGIRPEDYRKSALSLEGETSGWRGYFLCSAFVVEAVAQ